MFLKEHPLLEVHGSYTTLTPSAQAALLGGPFGHAEQAIRHHQDDLETTHAAWRVLGIPVNT